MTSLLLPALRRLIAAKAAHAQLPPWVSSHYDDSFLPSDWIEGLIMVESSGNPRARRYEPHQDRATRLDVRTDPDLPDVDDGELEDDASYGLMQVMGYNIRRLCGGVPIVLDMSPPWAFGRLRPARDTDGGPHFMAPMSFAFALDADVNIWLGIQVLKAELSATRGDVDRALARYNGGPTGDDPRPELGGDMRLRKYVDKVYQASLIASRR